MTWWNRWVSFWSNTEDGTALAGFRIGIGLALLYTFGMPYWDGAVEAIWVDEQYGGMRSFRKLPWLIDGLGGASAETMFGMVYVGLLSAGFLIVGVAPRAAALTGMVLLNNIAWHNGHAGGGHDDLIANALWILVFSNSTATLSLTCKWQHGTWTSTQEVPSWPRYVALLQLLLMYTSTGWQKLSAHWVPFGELSALWYILQQPTWARFPVDWLAPFAWTTNIATLTTWIFETCAPLLLLALYYEATPDRSGRLRHWFNTISFRKIFIVVGLSMHIGIAIFMVVGPFSIASVAYYCTIRTPKQRSPLPNI